ncbi:MAG: hypothetical protein FWD17_09820 [Polyangiaceae bacterium]|nr:hypothetical protein [Polyangiaceae bacterium]
MINFPPTITYGDLSTCSDEYEAMKRVRRSINDFYTGGFRLANNVGAYIPKMLGENPKRYGERIRSGAYINYFAQIVDYFAGALFTQELSIRPPSDAKDKSTMGDTPNDDDVYTRFAKNSDGAGKCLNEILHDTVITALKHGTAWLHVELPKAADEVKSKADEEALGLGVPYLFEVPHEQIIDCDWDDDDELTYLVCRTVKKLKGPPGRRKKNVLESFTVWIREENEVACAIYAIEYDPNKAPLDTDDVSLVETTETSFTRIPILRMELPDGLWAGNKLCPMAKEHFQRRTSLNSAENRSMVAIPVVKLGPEVPAPGGDLNEAATNPDRGSDPVSQFVSKGYEVIGAGDDMLFVEPDGKAYDHVAKRITDLKDEMFRISHQMAAAASMGSSAIRRSGQSKEQDRAAEAIVLAAIGRIVRAFAIRIYETISTARGEKVEWVAHGLDTFESEEREQLLEEAVSVAQVDIPSQTFRKEHAKRLARKLVPNMPPATIATIDQEIDEGTEDDQRVRDLEQDVHVAELKSPQPQSPAAGAPKMPKAPVAR